jgi:hypothetical protein
LRQPIALRCRRRASGGIKIRFRDRAGGGIGFKFGHSHAVHGGRISQAALRQLNNLFGDQRCDRVGTLR